MLNEFFHQLEVIWFDSMKTASIVLAIFLDCQVAQNQVKVATDGSFCADTTFVQTPLKIFLFTLRLRSRYLKGTPELALYASKKIGTIRCTDRIILKEK